MRTPFQRDRDRIVHSKPFRRLKGKTQVFIDPAGDHYRTRMTHTLETTAISRVVARALRLNEDLVEAIGLGHDMGHPPFGHAGEDALDAALRERFGGGFRHNEQSLRIAERLNLTRRGSRRHPHAHRRARARRRSRARSSASSTASRTSTTTSTTRSATGSSQADDLPRDEIELLGPTGSERIDTLVHDLVETSAARGRHRPERRDRRGDALAAGVHVRAGVPRASTRARARRARTRRSRAIFDAPRRRAATIAGRDRRVHRRHDRPVRAALRGDARLVARIKDTRVEAVKQAADFVALVEERTRLRKVGGALHRPLPVPRGEDAELLRHPGSRHLHCFGCGNGGDMITFVAGDRGPRLRRRDRVARRPVQRPARVRGRVAGGGRARGGGASGSTRCSSRRPRSTSATSGTARRASRSADYLAGRGLGEDVCREFRLGLSPGGNSLARKAREKGFTQTSCAAAGLVTPRGGDYFQRRLMFPLADARGRVSASRRASCTRTIRCAAST